MKVVSIEEDANSNYNSTTKKTIKSERSNKKKRYKRIIRIERQEYPNDSLHASVERKLSSSLAA